jgi:V/A-type H+-transporting ATPase subunit A
MKMMEIILYLYKKSKLLIDMNIPMSVLIKEPIFEKIISIKYNVGNDEPEKLDGYFKEIDEFYDHVYKNY